MTGREYIQGKGNWLGALSALWEDAGRVFYSFTLVLAILTVLLALVSTVRPGVLHHRRLLTPLAAIAGAASLFLIGDFFWAHMGPVALPEWGFAIAFPAALYFVLPLVLWYRFGLSGSDVLRARWPRMRRIIRIVYAPAALFDVFTLAMEMTPGGLWGLPPYFLGMGLIACGYLSLARRASTTRTREETGGAERRPVYRAQPHAA